nr:PREDICTED: ladderlectin-like [Latimeria chalumnae]|eukprot:XP_006013734.1 PREDICTED: ladderlectin-like [Latimeria chalumnae]
MVSSTVKLTLTLLVLTSILHCYSQVNDSCGGDWCRCPIHGITHWKRYEDVCLRYVSTPMTFNGAQKHCRTVVDGGTLVSIHSSSWNQKIVQLIESESGSVPRTWIGGTRPNYNSKYYWLDGTSWDYENWVDGEPNNLFGLEYCLEINYICKYFLSTSAERWDLLNKAE